MKPLQDVAREWVNKPRPEGRLVGSGYRLWYDDATTIWSYGRHYPIARRVKVEGKDAFLFHDSYYSQSTKRHCDYVRSAIRWRGGVLLPWDGVFTGCELTLEAACMIAHAVGHAEATATLRAQREREETKRLNANRRRTEKAVDEAKNILLEWTTLIATVHGLRANEYLRSMLIGKDVHLVRAVTRIAIADIAALNEQLVQRNHAQVATYGELGADRTLTLSES